MTAAPKRSTRAARGVGPLLNRAIRAHQAGRLNEAQSIYGRLLGANPGEHTLRYLAGVCHLQQGQPAEAIPLIEGVLAVRADYAEAHSNLGAALNALGRHQEAVARYHRALALRPDFADAHFNLGNALVALDRWDEAVVHYRRAIELRPISPEAHKRLGDVFAAVYRHHDACRHYAAALALRPEYVDAANNLGNSFMALHQPEEALAQYAKALAIAPCFAEGHSNFAVALAALGRHDEALSSFDDAIALKRDYAEAYYGKANSLTVLGRPDEAIEYYRHAIDLDAGSAAAHFNLGTVLGALNRHVEAVTQYDRTLAIDPAYPDAAWNRSLSLLALGEYRDGWLAYEARWTRASALKLPNDHVFLWTGHERVAGRTVLIQHEQGYGDAIQMLRFVPGLERLGAQCVIQAPPALAGLLERSFPRARVVPLGMCPPDVDLRVPVMSLPLALKLFAESDIPRSVPYLSADRETAARWAARIQGRTAPHRTRKVGLVWRGLATHANDQRRSLAPHKLRSLLERRDIQFVTLQKQLTTLELRQLTVYDNVLMIDEELRSFDDTASVMAALDLVISVDSAPVHLSGALGKPTWVLLPLNADWRWGLHRTDSQWYPTARLFRQHAVDDWSAVIEQVGAALDERAM